MYYQLLERTALSDGEVVTSQPVDVSGMPTLLGSLTVYRVGGTTPSVSITLETSDDGEIWDDFATTGQPSASASGFDRAVFLLATEKWGRLVRARASVGGGSGDETAEFALGLQSFVGT